MSLPETSAEATADPVGVGAEVAKSVAAGDGQELKDRPATIGWKNYVLWLFFLASSKPSFNHCPKCSLAYA